MPHLSPEIVARIVDGPATADEVAHLDACTECREDLARTRAAVEALGELPDPEPPPGLWSRLEANLAPIPERPRRIGPLPRAAAAVTLFVVGTATGWILRGPPDPDTAPAEEPLASASADDPEARLRRAESFYVEAVTDYLEARPQASPTTVIPYERIAALRGIALTARAALEQAPDDPVIGGYYRTAVAQQRAVMSNMAAPASDEDEPWF